MSRSTPIDCLPPIAERRAGNASLSDGGPNARSVVIDHDAPDSAYGTYRFRGAAIEALSAGLHTIDASFIRDWIVPVYRIMQTRGWPVNLALEQLAAYEHEVRVQEGVTGIPAPVLLQ